MAWRACFEPHGTDGHERSLKHDQRALEGKGAWSSRAQLAAACPARKPSAIDLAVVREERDDRSPVAVERLGARGRPRRPIDAVGQLFEPRMRLGLAQERCDPLDLLGPHHCSEMKRASSNT